MSVKNKLQEFYQKQGKPPPQYESLRKGGSDHAPIFESTVTLADGKQYVAESCTKKKAEMAAATKALKHTLISKPLPQKPNQGIRKKICILVDLENRPKIPQQLSPHISNLSNIDLIAFASSEHHTLKSLKDACLSKVQIIEVPCTRKNGADIGIVLFTGLLLHRDYQMYIIVSGDNFGYCLADCIQGIDKMVEYNGVSPQAVCCKTLEGVLENL